MPGFGFSKLARGMYCYNYCSYPKDLIEFLFLEIAYSTDNASPGLLVDERNTPKSVTVIIPASFWV